jgi:4-hydroxybenzoate polyprenyltransferase
LPNENPSPRTFFEGIEDLLYALQLYGAVGIAAFGWAMGHLLGLDPTPQLPLWFCAAMLIYQADRLRLDPADPLNIPRRAAACARWRWLTWAAVAIGAAGLVGIPLWRRNWIVLGLVLLGSFVSLGYSAPLLGKRWKDVPVLKTLFAPTLVTAAVFALLMLAEVTDPTKNPIRLFDSLTWLLPWAFAYLLFNMVLCDLRDREGDAVTGIRSIPVFIGEKHTRTLLWGLATLGQVLLVVGLRFQRDNPLPFGLLALFTGMYQVVLLVAVSSPRSERFYEWAVEGMLYLPALAFLVAGVLKIAIR